jgi:diguanylate cyclase (GGDEF)-like protein/PAS domain S-box-containing protein
MFVFDQRTQQLLEVNDAAVRCYGYTHDEFLSMRITDLRASDQPNGSQYYPELEENITRRPLLRRHQQKDGRLVDVEIVSQKLELSDRPTVLMVAHDITERKALESQLLHQAFHDTLSNLPNRALFLDRLQHALSRAARRKRRVSVMFLDLDNFKVINDSLGHQAGDTLLVTIAQRLLSTVRPEDIVARLGGDEFTILIDDVVSEDDAIQVAHRIADELRIPVKLGSQDVFVTTSIGIAVSSEEQNDAEKLLRAADLAMYQAKSSGKARYSVFDPSLDTKAIDRLQLEIDLRAAIERHELQIYYQPILSLATGEITEVEALSRWNHPTRGFVPPTAFIPVAEETGLIMALSRSVMLEACRQTKQWQDENADREPLVVAVNVSARDLRDPGFLDFVFETLHETQLSSSSLKLEITESVAIDDADSAAGKLQMLRDIGIKIAIDDFGTGYSSLSYLQRFPATSVKIDRAFVERLEKGSLEDSAIVDTIISLARTLNMDVVGEGIESSEQLNQLQQLGCTKGQGFFFAKPMPPESIGPLLGFAPLQQAA